MKAPSHFHAIRRSVISKERTSSDTLTTDSFNLVNPRNVRNIMARIRRGKRIIATLHAVKIRSREFIEEIALRLLSSRKSSILN